MRTWPLKRIVFLGVNLLLFASVNSTVLAQGLGTFGPNAGLIQRQMLMPGSNWFGRPADMYYGPVTREEAGLSSPDYVDPVVVQDGIIHAQIMNPIQKPLKVVPK